VEDTAAAGVATLLVVVVVVVMVEVSHVEVVALDPEWEVSVRHFIF
jgi:hypothetical protein